MDFEEIFSEREAVGMEKRRGGRQIQQMEWTC